MNRDLSDKTDLGLQRLKSEICQLECEGKVAFYG